MRPTLEVADVFRRHGAAFLDQHNAHRGRVERRVMAAIETCRTPALGGHVEQCNDCGLVRCAYNSCLMGKFRNGESRAAPTCRGPRYNPTRPHYGRRHINQAGRVRSRNVWSQCNCLTRGDRE